MDLTNKQNMRRDWRKLYDEIFRYYYRDKIELKGEAHRTRRRHEKFIKMFIE